MLLLFIAACTAQDRVLLEPKANPDEIYFIPSVDTEGVLARSEVLVKLVERETGYFFVCAVTTSYLVSIGTNKWDIA